MNRRKFLTLTSFTLITPLMAEYWNIDWTLHHPNDYSIELAIADITKGKKLEKRKIKLLAPEIAENGAVVPLRVDVESPMTKENYIKGIYILTEHGNSRTAYVYLTPANGKAYFSTRVKLKSTGKVIAIAEQSDGQFFVQNSIVKVTVGGGCC